MSILVSWARKEVARLRNQKPKALLLPPKSRPPVHCSSVGEIEIAADIRCAKCRIRVADEMSKMEGLDSMEVDISQKKVILIRRFIINN
ncbi:hypothetical protein OSB04_014679 [Centaurea solstitialis]|uniref:HMA domain-containing protein n=1 Tax=Centaurea solstitialis TaxID=347529 RepID=A0AA38SXJ4_9ASTR|nr:hypothetical protein OSB04_014679 [Centaurea solstitialis]